MLIEKEVIIGGKILKRISARSVTDNKIISIRSNLLVVSISLFLNTFIFSMFFHLWLFR